MNEEWRLMPSGLYEISNYGNVRRATDGINTRAGQPKRVSLSSNGYLIFGHFDNGKHTNILVHKAAAEAFLGIAPEGMQVNHKDGNKLNNRIDNLEYVTVSENARHAYRMGLSRPPTNRAIGNNHWTRLYPDRIASGERNGAHTKPEQTLRGSECPSSKLTEENVRAIRVMYAENLNMNTIADKFGITRRNVSYIVNHKTWRHVK